jgi:hypothetical protein
MTDLDPEGQDRQRLARLPFAQRMADVCPGCGRHVLPAPKRFTWVTTGSFPPLWCELCGILKPLAESSGGEPFIVTRTTIRHDLATAWLDETARQ